MLWQPAESNEKKEYKLFEQKKTVQKLLVIRQQSVIMDFP